MAKAQKTSYAETAPSAMGRAPAVASTKLTDQLSPNRGNALKVTSLEDGNIRGGYWVLNQDGEGATIVFCYKNSDGGIFGLTVGHLFQNVGDSVFVFLRNHPTPAPVPGYVRSCAAWDEMDYELIEVGGVVSLDEETDSAVFEVNDAHIKGRVDLLKLLRRSGRGDRDLVLPRPCLNPLPPGRQDFLEDESDGDGRAAMDKKPAAKAAPDPNSKPFDRVDDAMEVDIGFELESGCTASATDDGDCGALLLDANDSSPLAMHHALVRYPWPGYNKPVEYGSFGVPLAPIMAKHPDQFDKEMYGELETASDSMDGGGRLSVSGSVRDGLRQGAVTNTSHQIKTSPVKIVTGNVDELLAAREKSQDGT
ncbi:expressed unknown protein [Seminavis robusta]|uniref:Uncharacterized protein n=1 Tax=Seminavis robusta TaxID=568900 RepID=A0A9N8EMH7_9STRA|nr:expressed unknown protein [Seminavis robusta]|eukprot:Sro1473_g275600.1 n/a (365) ;mRNA; r:7539-8716